MNYLKLFILLLLLLIFPHFLCPALELFDDKSVELELNILFIPVYEFEITNLINGFYFKGAKIGVESEYNNRIKFIIDLDFSEINTESDALSPGVIENLYLQYKFFEQLKIRGGQFKVPVGEEISVGITQRPYLNHSIGSNKLIPGRRRGLMVSGENCFSIIGYRAGIFNTSEPNEPKNSTPYLSTAGKLFLSFELMSKLKIKTGYSVYYSFEEIFAESFFLNLKWKVNKSHTLSLFSEYLEQRFYHYQWNNSVFLCTSYRFKSSEIYCTGEIYQENVGNQDSNDCIQICSGVNVYWNKDTLKAGLGYTYKSEYEINKSEHLLYLMFRWEQ